jgi:hypothetical protein
VLTYIERFKQLLVCPLYGAQTPEQQQRAFLPPNPQRYRKVVLATNIAETSITVPFIKYVIDPGVVKARLPALKLGHTLAGSAPSLTFSTSASSLVVVPISKAQVCLLFLSRFTSHPIILDIDHPTHSDEGRERHTFVSNFCSFFE